MTNLMFAHIKTAILNMRVHSIILLIFLGDLSTFGITFNNGLKCISALKSQRTSRQAEQYKGNIEDSVESDPNVALEGQCIVVCDADIIGLKTSLEKRSQEANAEKYYQNQELKNTDENMRTGPVTEDSSTSSGKLSSRGCGDIMGIGRRNRRVAFSVKRSTELTTVTTAINGRATVTFDHVMVNVGNAFDMESSNFVAPVSGVYSLYFQVYRLYNKSPLTIDLLVNGIPIIRGFADGEGDNHNSAHNKGIVHLRARDRVELQVIGGNLESGWKYSTYSGFLIFEDEDL
ncbi:cerebellin-4-like [Styela clava]